MTGRIVVTGASGLLGRTFCEYFSSRGWEVIGLVRNPRDRQLPALPVRWLACDLPEDLPADAMRGAHVVVHCAYDTRGVDPAVSESVNIEGTRRVRDAAREEGVSRFVFLSSLSADPTAGSLYGRTKWQLEGELDPSRDLAIRAGLVLSREGGLVGEMVRWIHTHAWIPVPGPMTPIHTVLAEDLARALDRALETGRSGTVSVAHPEPIRMGRLIRGLCSRLGHRRVLVPIPLAPAQAIAFMLERFGMVHRQYSERLSGLRVASRTDRPAPPLLAGVHLRSPEQSLDHLWGGTSVPSSPE